MAALLLITLHLTSASASASPISSEALGTNVFTAMSGGQLVPSNLRIASSSGLGAVRKEMIQGTNEDPIFSLAATAHLRVAPMLGLSQQLSPSAAATAMASYVTSFAQRYGPGGTFWSQNPTLPYLPVESYEIGNEPNMPLQWVADSTHLHWSDPSAYAQVYAAARAALRRVDPSGVAVVGGLADSASGGVDVQSDEQWLAALSPATVDAVGYHPYTFDVSDSLMSVDTAQLRQWMNAHGFGAAPLYVNELDACQVTATSSKNLGSCPSTGQQSSAIWGAALAAYTEWALCTPGLNVQAVMPFYWGDTPWADNDVWLTLTTTEGSLTPYGQQYLAEAHALTTAGCPPVNTAAPTISGTAAIGQTLVGEPGAWASTPAPSLTYQWERCDSADANCENIAGATLTSYQVQPADVGRTLVLSVTARNQGGSATAASLPTAVAPDPSSGAGGATSTPARPPDSARAPTGPRAATSRLGRLARILRVSGLKSRSRIVTLTLRIAPQADLVRIMATRGHHHVALRRHHRRLATATRAHSTVRFSGRLTRGRWTITVICMPPPGYGAAVPLRRKITIVG